MTDMTKIFKSPLAWWILIVLLVIIISVLHYVTPTMKWQYHLILMQSYFIPILLAAFQFGVKGGWGTALLVSFIYFPHVMLQWGGLIETNLMRFLQILLFNIIGYLTGVKAQQEQSEKKRYQQTAEKLEVSLKKLEDQSEKMEEMEEYLRQADRLSVIGEMTASLAHEVRNPLGSIRGAVDILRDELPPQFKQSEFFSILVEETQRLNRVVEDYLNFAGKPRYSEVRFDVREIIRNSQLLLKHRAQKGGISFQIRIPESPLFIRSDPQQLQQVLINLLLNAIQVLPQGGHIRLESFTDLVQNISPPLPGERDSSNQNLIIIVSDDGPGIDKDNLEKIFRPFYSTREEGTGLGLAIVKRICDQNKWQIQVTSEKGKGTAFTLIIPVEPGDSSKNVHTENSGEEAPEGKII
jgi:signal transduction histidine kinase